MNLPTITVAEPPSFFEFQNVWDFDGDGIKDAIRVSKIAKPSVEDQQFGFGEVDRQPWVASIAYMNADGVVLDEKLAEDDLGFSTRIAEDVESESEIFSVCISGDLNHDGAGDEICVERGKYSVDEIVAKEAEGQVLETADTGQWRLLTRQGVAGQPLYTQNRVETTSVPTVTPLPIDEHSADLVSRGPLVIHFPDQE